MSRPRHGAFVLSAALALLAAPAAAACPSCYGAADGPVIEGARLSVLFLGGFLYLLLAGGAAVVLAHLRRLRRRSGAGESRPGGG